ncbi:MAG: GAF domain-containing sensor histidine kinase [Chloroflexota bacterium]
MRNPRASRAQGQRTHGATPPWSIVRRLAGLLGRNTFTPTPSPQVEWAWVAGRLILAGVVAAGAASVVDQADAARPLFIAAAFVYAYSLILAFLLLRGRTGFVLTVGFALDHLTLLFAWWRLDAALQGASQTNDLYLVLFPILVFGVARLGWKPGVAYSVFWAAWVWWVTNYYFPADGYDVRQAPVRILFLLATAGLTIRLVAQLQGERRTAEALREETEILANIGRIANSSLRLQDIREDLAEELRKLIPFQSLTLCDVDQENRSAMVAFVYGESRGDFQPGHPLPMHQAAVERALKHWGPQVVAPASEPEVRERMGPGTTEEIKRLPTEALLAPIWAGDELVGLLIASAEEAGTYTERHVTLAASVATYISSAVANARAYARALQLAEEREERARLDAANQELQRTNEARRTILSTVSHDLKNPLASARSFASLLAREHPGDPEGSRPAKYVWAMGRSLDRMGMLISDLQDMSKIDAGELSIEPTFFRVGDLVGDIAESYQPTLAQKGQRLVTAVNPQEAVARADRDRLEQALSNFLSNASKYAPADTTVCLRAELAEGMLVFQVEDQGIGMSQDDQERLFTPFFRAGNRATQSQPGTGLGLVIARYIFRLHGGDVAVRSAPGEGTSVTASLPVSWTAETAEHTEQQESGSPDAVENGQTTR